MQDKLQNYSYIVMEADYVNPEDFQTDLKHFFRFMQARNDKSKMQKLLRQVDDMELSVETQQVISIHIGQKEIEKKVIEEGETMCKAIRDMMKDERQEGRREAIAANMTIIMQKFQLTLDQAMDMLNVEMSEREMYRELLMKQ